MSVSLNRIVRQASGSHPELVRVYGKEGKPSWSPGDKLVQLGGTYMSYGQYDKAVASITKGIAKGGLKSPDEANLLLGLAQLRQRNNAAAQQAFDKVASSSNNGYARLGKLWALRAHSA